MKKITFILVIIFGTLTQAQSHEVKFNASNLIGFNSLELTYQHIFNEESSVGMSIAFSLADKSNIFGTDENFAITPYYRHYFQLSGVEDVFGEAFFSINSGEGKSDEADTKDEIVDYSDGAFGFAIGKSYISPRGFVAEAYVGAGKNLFEADGAPNLVPRIGLSLGYRF